MTKMRINYSVLKDLKLFDSEDKLIKLDAKNEQIPLLDGGPVNLLRLCPPKANPVRFELVT